MNPLVMAMVLVAGGIGAVLRYCATLLFPYSSTSNRIPLGVFLVNAVGSLAAGFLLGLAAQAGISAEWKLIFVTGLCGGLTTFSTLSVDTIQLVEHGRVQTAVASIAANLTVGVALAALGYMLA